jgi:hypothetical protein
VVDRSLDLVAVNPFASRRSMNWPNRNKRGHAISA